MKKKSIRQSKSLIISLFTAFLCLAAGTVRAQLFLSRGDYSPAALEEIAAGAPSPEFRALLEEHIDPVQLKHAMVEVNTAVINLFMLWVEPYFRIEERLQ